jgi:cytochrome P450
MVNRPERITTEEQDGPKSYILPAGTRVYLNAPAVHYSDKHWPDHKKLDPTRWYDPPSGAGQANRDSNPTKKKVVAADKTRHMRGTLITFSDGSRACLGRKFSQAEYIAFMATLLRDYRVELAPGSDPKVVERDINLKCAGKLTLAPLDNVKLSLRRRKA